jgi:hypothetical protein
MGRAKDLGGELKLKESPAPLPAQSTPTVTSALPKIDRAANYTGNQQNRCAVPSLVVPEDKEALGRKAVEDLRRLAIEHDGALESLCSRAQRGIKPGWRPGTPTGGIGHTLTVGKVDPKSGGTAVTVYAGLEGGFLSPHGVVGLQAVVMPTSSSTTGTQMLFDASCSAPSNSNGPEGPTGPVCRASLYAKWR